jgi:hypothetical protein
MRLSMFVSSPGRCMFKIQAFNQAKKINFMIDSSSCHSAPECPKLENLQEILEKKRQTCEITAIFWYQK